MLVWQAAAAVVSLPRQTAATSHYTKQIGSQLWVNLVNKESEKKCQKNDQFQSQIVNEIG